MLVAAVRPRVAPAAETAAEAVAEAAEASACWHGVFRSTRREPPATWTTRTVLSVESTILWLVSLRPDGYLYFVR